MLEIIEKYPIAYAELFEWANLNHGMTPEKFSYASQQSQAITIISWFGYAERLPKTKELTISFLHQILGDFDKAARRYPDSSIDLITEISKMNEKERQEKHPELFNQHLEPTILPSLRDAFDFNLIPLSQQQEAEHNDFWNNVVVKGEAPF